MAATIPQITGLIEERLVAVRLGLDEARVVMKKIEAEEAGLARALRALAPEHPLIAKAEVEGKPKKKPNTQQVSEPTVQKVKGIVSGALGPVTINEIAEVAGKSSASVSAALRVLRERQEVRLAGTSPRRGNPSLFAPMNGGVHA